MAEKQFTSVITDEAMQNINYSQGWILKPYHCAVMNKDILGNLPDSDIFDEEGNMRPRFRNMLLNYTTEDFNQDVADGYVWFEQPFSGLQRVDNAPDTITHHVIIPGNHEINEPSKEVKTLIFLYLPISGGRPFVYAVARSNNYIVYEPGVTQSYFFNFTVTNSQAIDTTDFVINYTYPQEIADHNNPTYNDNYEGVHDFLMDRKGTRSITGPFVYTSDVKNCADDDYPLLGLITKKYAKELFDLLYKQVQEEVCPPGTLYWYPGTPKQFMASTLGKSGNWCVRDGRLLEIAQNPKLYALLKQTYNTEYTNATGKNYNQETHFPIMDDRALFIRGCEWQYDNAQSATTDGAGSQGTTYLKGVGVGKIQSSGAPNITGKFKAHQMTDDRNWPDCGNASGAWSAIYAVRDVGECEDGKWSNGWSLRFDASRVSGVYQNNLNEVRPNNRNYTPIIRLG